MSPWRADSRRSSTLHGCSARCAVPALRSIDTRLCAKSQRPFCPPTLSRPIPFPFFVDNPRSHTPDRIIYPVELKKVSRVAQTVAQNPSDHAQKPDGCRLLPTYPTDSVESDE